MFLRLWRGLRSVGEPWVCWKDQCYFRVFHDFKFSQGDYLFDIFMDVVVHDKKMESSLLGASQV